MAIGSRELTSSERGTNARTRGFTAKRVERRTHVGMRSSEASAGSKSVRATKKERLPRAFTLIELLVVIAIIGVISSVVLASLNSARAKARDAQRLSDFSELRSALELYASDNGGSYPSTSMSWFGACPNFGGKSTTGASGWVPNLAPTYIPVLPVDPKPSGPSFCYLYRSNGVDYMLLAYQTVETYTSTTNRWKRLGGPTEADFAFYTPGASMW